MKFMFSRLTSLRVQRIPRLGLSSSSRTRPRLLSVSAANSGPKAKTKSKSAAETEATPKHSELEPEDKTNLPQRQHWRKIFSSWSPINDRISLSNPETAAQVANSFVPPGEKDKVIIEAFPGPGQLTRALLALPKSRISRIIVLENEPKYLEYLTPLAAADPRVEIVPHTAHSWTTFDLLEENGMLKDIETASWDQVHPRLQFISHLPITVYGEQLIAQFLRLIPSRTWLYKYGRIKMNFLLSEYIWQRLTARPGDTSLRCKLSVMADATADCQLLMYDQLQPFRDHFHPMPLRGPQSTLKDKPGNRRIGIPFQAVSITPLQEQVIDPLKLDIWDYCVRRLFVRKATALSRCIEDLGPGAQSLIPKLKETIDTEVKVRELSVVDWAEIVRAFDEWPFSPTDLGIGDAMLDNYGGRGILNKF